MGSGYLSSAMLGALNGTEEVEGRHGRRKRWSTAAPPRDPERTGTQRLCTSLLVQAIVEYVAGESEARWWLFEEGQGSMSASVLPLTLVCEILELDVAFVRECVRALPPSPGLTPVQARVRLSTRRHA